MSQVNGIVAQVDRRTRQRLLTAMAVVAAMGMVAAIQLRQEAARMAESAAPPHAAPAPGR
jgi:hypothetical protein